MTHPAKGNQVPSPPLGITARAEIIRWIDADTLVVRIGWPVHVRLMGCNAPETGTPEGDKALRFVESLRTPGESIVVHIPTEHSKSIGHLWSFERLPADVWLDPEDDHTLTELLIRSGHARAG